MRDATVAAPKQHRLQESLPTASKAHSACRPTDGNRARQSPCKHPYTKTHQSFKATPRGKPKFVYFNQKHPKATCLKATCLDLCNMVQLGMVRTPPHTHGSAASARLQLYIAVIQIQEPHHDLTVFGLELLATGALEFGASSHLRPYMALP